MLALLLSILCEIGGSSSEFPAWERSHRLQDVARTAVSSEPEKLALLIGIDRYASGQGNAGFEDLAGCANDVLRMRQLLIERFGFAPDQVRTLLNEEATHAAIVGGIKSWLIDRAGRNTEVLLWYSGHGSRAPDASGLVGVEYAKKDSTWVAYDSRGAGVPDISDDEIFSLLQALHEKTSRITVVTDCCHSGGNTRGPAAPVARYAEDASKSIGWEQIRKYWPQDVDFYEDGQAGRATNLTHVHIAACAPFQQADEYRAPAPGGQSQVFGALTYFLTQTLERIQPGASYEQLAQEVGLAIRTRFSQDIQVEGDLRRQVFGANFEKPLPGLAASASRGRDAWWIDVEGGALNFLEVGDRLQVLNLDGEKLGTAVLEEVEALNSSAKWGDAPAHLEADVFSVRVVLQGGQDQERYFRLYVPAGQQEDEYVRALQADTGLPWQVIRDVQGNADAQFYRPSEADDFLLSTVPNGVALAETAFDMDYSAEEAARLSEVLLREWRYRQFLTMAGYSGRLQIQVSLQKAVVEDLEGAQESDDWELALAELQAGDRVIDYRDQEEVLRVHVENLSGQEFYLTVFMLNGDRSISLLYGEHHTVLEPRESLVVPIIVAANPPAPDGSLLWDRIIALATVEPMNLLMFGSGSANLDQAADAAQRVRRGGPQVPWILESALLPAISRGTSSLKESAWQYGMSTVDLLVIPAGHSRAADH